MPAVEILRQAALFGTRNRDGWGTGLTVLTALGNVLPMLAEREIYLALFNGAGRGAEESTGWRSPMDLVALCQEGAGELADVFTGQPGRPWSDHAVLADGLLGDDPAAIVGALTAAARAGASPADLGRSLAYAAA